jgi:large subunit ribosomal protein L25
MVKRIKIFHRSTSDFESLTVTNMELSLECAKRAANEKPNALRRDGQVPAVLYGHDGIESVALKVNTREAEALLRKAKTQKTVIDVNVPDMPWSGKAILQEVQTHQLIGAEVSQRLRISFGASALIARQFILPMTYRPSFLLMDDGIVGHCRYGLNTTSKVLAKTRLK